MATNLNSDDGYVDYGFGDIGEDDFFILNEGIGSNDNNPLNIFEEDDSITICGDFHMIEDVDNSVNNADDINDYLNTSDDNYIIDSSDIFL